MKAALWYARNDVRVEDVAEPGPPGPGEMILTVVSCRICGTDLEEHRSGPLFIAVDQPNPLTGRMAPVILGHEFAGEVVEVGRDVTRLKPGHRVAPDVLITCGACYWCRRHQVTLCDKLAALGFSGDGGLAEYCKVPVSMCITLPNGLSCEHAACTALKSRQPIRSRSWCSPPPNQLARRPARAASLGPQMAINIPHR